MNLITINKDSSTLPPLYPVASRPEVGQMCLKSSSERNDKTLSPSSQLFLCHGIIAILRLENLVKKISVEGGEGCLLLDVILPKVFEIVER